MRSGTTHSEQDEELLVVLAHAVVHPGAVVVHLAYAALAHRAVVGSLWLDAATLGALEDDLSFPQPHALYILPCGIALRDSTLVDNRAM